MLLLVGGDGKQHPVDNRTGFPMRSDITCA